MAENKATQESISLYPIDREIIIDVGQKQSRSFSGAVQFIIREYKRLTAQAPSPAPTQPTTTHCSRETLDSTLRPPAPTQPKGRRQ